MFILRPSSGDEVMQMWREYIFIQDFQAEREIGEALSFLSTVRADKDLSQFGWLENGCLCLNFLIEIFDVD